MEATEPGDGRGSVLVAPGVDAPPRARKWVSEAGLDWARVEFTDAGRLWRIDDSPIGLLPRAGERV